MPADAGLRRVIAFQNRPGIDITFLLPAERAKKLVDFIELVCNQVVIVIAPRISRDSACSGRRVACLRAFPGNNSAPKQRSSARPAIPSADHSVFLPRAPCNSFHRVPPSSSQFRNSSACGAEPQSATRQESKPISRANESNRCFKSSRELSRSIEYAAVSVITR